LQIIEESVVSYLRRKRARLPGSLVKIA